VTARSAGPFAAVPDLINVDAKSRPAAFRARCIDRRAPGTSSRSRKPARAGLSTSTGVPIRFSLTTHVSSSRAPHRAGSVEAIHEASQGSAVRAKQQRRPWDSCLRWIPEPRDSRS